MKISDDTQISAGADWKQGITQALAAAASRAQELATSAPETFTLSRTRYDITHARVTLSRAALASGHERLAVQQGALARSAVQVMGYGLLCVPYPEDVFDLAWRIDGA